MPILPASLNLLMWLRMKAALRRILVGMKSVRGCLMMVFFLFMMFSWLPFAFMGGDQAAGAQAVGRVAEALDIPAARIPAVGLLWACLFMIALPNSGPGILFRSNEIEFLFTGPFSRRQLVLYKIAGVLGGLISVVFFLALFSFRFSPGGYPQAAIGIMLTLSFISLFRICVSMLTQSVLVRLHSRFRVFAVLGLAGIVVLMGYPLLAGQASAGIAGLRPVVLWLSTPFVPFAQALLAQDYFTGFLPWAAVALVMDAGLVFLIVRLDVDYREAALRQAQDMQVRIERAKRSGASLSGGRVKSVGTSLPQLPRMGGTGAILWRQLLTARRHGTKISVIMLAVPAVIIAIHIAGYNELLKGLVPAFAALVFIVPQFIQFDFRSDIDKMGWLKTLPIPPFHMAVGQLATPVLLATLVYVFALGTYAALTGLWVVLVGTLLFVPPVVALMYCIDNWMFFQYPLPPMQQGMDPRQMFQIYVVTLFKLFALALFAGIAAGLGGLAYWATSSLPLVFAVVFLSLVAELIPCILAVGVAFRRFDINRIPGE